METIKTDFIKIKNQIKNIKDDYPLLVDIQNFINKVLNTAEIEDVSYFKNNVSIYSILIQEYIKKKISYQNKTNPQTEALLKQIEKKIILFKNEEAFSLTFLKIGPILFKMVGFVKSTEIKTICYAVSGASAQLLTYSFTEIEHTANNLPDFTKKILGNLSDELLKHRSFKTTNHLLSDLNEMAIFPSLLNIIFLWEIFASYDEKTKFFQKIIAENSEEISPEQHLNSLIELLDSAKKDSFAVFLESIPVFKKQDVINLITEVVNKPCVICNDADCMGYIIIKKLKDLNFFNEIRRKLEKENQYILYRISGTDVFYFTGEFGENAETEERSLSYRYENRGAAQKANTEKRYKIGHDKIK